MTLTLELPQTALDALTSEAERRGTTPEQMLTQDVLQKYGEAARARTPQERHERVQKTERVQKLLQWAKQLPHGTPLSDEATSREAIYAREDDVNYGAGHSHA